uniref:Venom sodium channel toxin-1 n=1 Tax=Mesobuthus eupeus TaxID=34648 RepID=E4VP15_MESEU|nr:venom sodium channel toxin-1 [Mesobuthus eupeus]
MMKIIIFLIVSSLMLIEVKTEDGYLVDRSNGCKIACAVNNEYCNHSCKQRGGNYGYCYFWKLACYCEGAPKSQYWYYETNKCKGKK